MHNHVKMLGIVLLTLACSATAYAQHAMPWEASLQDAKTRAAATNRLVLLHFWAPWCGPCRSMDKQVFAQPSVAAAIQPYFVPVKINADQFPIIRDMYGVSALPADVVITPQGQLLQRLQGAQSARNYVGRLQQIAVAAKPRLADTPSQIAMRQTPGAPPSAAQSSNTQLYRTTGYAPHSTASPSTAMPPAAEGQRQTPFDTAALPTQFPSQQPRGAVATPPSIEATQAMRSPTPTASPHAPLIAAGRPVESLAGALPPGSPPLGLNGYCPVALSEGKEWLQGDRRWGVRHQGRTYLFAGPEQQQRFLNRPDRYAPVLSGDDIVIAADENRKVAGHCEHGVFFGGKVYLFSSENSLETFRKNPKAYANQALQWSLQAERITQRSLWY